MKLLQKWKNCNARAGTFTSHSLSPLKALPWALLLRGRRKSSQKLAKRRTFVWGEGVSSVFAKQASKIKIKIKKKLHVDYVRFAPLGPAANRLEVDRAAQGLRCERVRRTSPSNAYKEKQVVEEFSEVWMILVTIRARRRIENLLSLSCAPAVPRPRDSRTSRAEATTAAVVLSDQATSGLSLTFSVSAATSSAERSETRRDSFNEAIYSSTSDLGLDAERLLTDDMHSARCS